MYLTIIFHLQNAEKSLQFYKRCGETNLEIEKIKQCVEEQGKSGKMTLADFLKRTALKGIFTSVAMSWFLQTTGSYTFTNYASLIFTKSGSIWSTGTSSIVLATVQITGGLVSTQMGDFFERKTTLFISLLGSAFGLISFSIYSYLLQNGYDVSSYIWVPVASLSLIIFISSAGIMALANTCAIENFPSKVRPTTNANLYILKTSLLNIIPQIRPAGMIWYSLCMNFVSFVGDKTFPTFIETIGLHGYFIALAVNCCLGLAFVAFMPKTKGQSLYTMDSVKGSTS